jgi:hypothetical protein
MTVRVVRYERTKPTGFGLEADLVGTRALGVQSFGAWVCCSVDSPLDPMGTGRPYRSGGRTVVGGGDRGPKPPVRQAAAAESGNDARCARPGAPLPEGHKLTE